MPPDEPTDEEKLEELPQDNQTPFQPAAPSADPTKPADDPSQGGTLDDTHPATDTGMDDQELYDAGISQAVGVEDPDALKSNRNVSAFNTLGIN